MNRITYNMGHNATAREAIAVHEYMSTEKRLQNDDGQLTITREPHQTRAIIQMFITPRLILVDNRDNRVSLRQIIANGLGVRYDELPFTRIDLPRMSRDYPEQWVRQFIDREGRIQRGSVYGDDVMRDAVFGNDLRRTPAKSIGSITRFFGAETPFRVTRDGVVLVLANPSVTDFLRFIESEILPYEDEVL